MAKSAVNDSESKELLLEIVENLASTLKEVQSLKKIDLETKKDSLDFCMKYYERARELMKSTKNTAPSDTETIKKDIPFLIEN